MGKKTNQLSVLVSRRLLGADGKATCAASEGRMAQDRAASRVHDRIPPSNWTARRRLTAVLRMAYRVVGIGKQRSVGKLGGGSAIPASPAGVALDISTALAAAIGDTTAPASIGHTAMPRILMTVSLTFISLTQGSGFAVAQYAAGGFNSPASGTTTAAGAGAVAIGGGAGGTATAQSANSIAIGSGAVANGTGAFASGYNAQSIGQGSVAIGNNVSASDVFANGGLNSTATGNIAIGENISNLSQGNSTAIGSQLTNGSYDTVLLGGDATVDGNSAGTFAVVNNSVGPKPTISNSVHGVEILTDANGNTVNNSARAFVLDTTSSTTGAVNYSNDTGSFIARTTSPAGTGASIQGINNAVNSVIINGAGAVTPVANVVSIGLNSLAGADNGVAIGANTIASNAGDVALGAGSTTAAAVATSGTVINGTAYSFAGATPTSTVSVGAPGAERTLTNVAAGRLTATSTDAVNGSALYATNTAIGSLATGGAGPVQYANGATPTTPNGGVPSQNLTLVGGAPGAVVLDNVAPGSLTTGSTQAVNGGQINGLGASLATDLGGGATFNPATGTVTAPGYVVAGQTYTNVGSALSAITGNSTTAGVMYFHANSTGPDSSATGADAIAVGVNAVSSGQNSIAVGGDANAANAANAAGPNSIAIGNQSKTTGGFATAVGIGSSAARQGSAYGEAATAGSTSIAAGFRANASGVNSTAIGGTAQSSGQYSLAAGTSASAAGLSSTALGNDASAVGAQSVAIGGSGGTSSANAAQALAANSVAIGMMSTATAVGDVALGSGSNTAATVATAGGTIGGVSTAFAGATPTAALSIGGRQIQNVAAGQLSAASTDGVNGSQLYATNTQLGATMGALTSSLGGGAAFDPTTGAYTGPSFAVGGGTYGNVGAALAALQTGAPLQYSTAAAPTTGNGLIASNDVTLVGANGGAPVALHNVAAGQLSAASTDGVNGGQLYATNANVAALTAGTAGLVQQTGGSPGGGAITVGAATGGSTVDVAGLAGNRTVTGVAAGTIGAASTDAVNGSQIYGSLSSVAAGLGGGSTVAANGTVTAPTYTVQGGTYNNVGGAIGAIDGDLTTLTTAVGGGGIKYFHANSPTGPDSQAVGTDAVAIGSGAVASNAGDVALGAGSTTAAAVATSGTVINGTAYSFAGATPTSTVSVGAPGAERTLTNVAAGRLTATSTDAVNGSELYATNTAIGSLATGGAGPVQYANGATPTTPNGGVPSQNLTLVGGAPGAVVLDNVAPGSLTTGSTQAVNGGQINGLGASLATDLGGGATFNPVTGTVTAPGYAVAGGTQTNVGAALAALDTASQMQGAGLAAALGGGAGVAPDGTVTGPSFAVGGGTYGNVGAALAALQTGAPLQYSTAAAPTTGNGLIASNDVTLVGANGGAPVALHNVAAGQLSAASTDGVNGGQLYATNANVAALTVGTAGLVQQTGGSPGGGAITVGAATGGSTVDVAGLAGNRTVTGVAAGTIGAASTDAVNGSQIYGSLSSVAAGLGGGSTVAANGTVTAPTYTVQGGTYNNVGGAIGAIDGDLTTLTTAVGGGGIKYFHANSPTGPDSQAVGTDAVAIGSGAVASNAGDVALGAGSTTAAAVATSGTVINGTAYSFAGATPTSTVSVGAPGAERTLTNVAAGRLTATSTDAVNGSELYATNTAIGSLATGGAGPVQYANGATPTTPNGGVPSQNLTLVGGAPGAVVLDNVAPGSLTTGSTQAVNGGQINGLGASLATDLGGGATFNPVTGTVTAPGYAVAGGTQTNVGAALAALDTASQMQGAGLAAALGGGAGVAPDGTVTGPSFAVGGGTYGNVGAALAALQTGAPLQYSTAAAPTTGNGLIASNDVTLVGANGGAPVALHNVAAGQLSAASTDGVNGGQLYATNANVAALTAGTAGLVQQTGGSPGGGAITVGAATGGSTVDVAGLAGNRTVTGVAAGTIGAASTDAVNGSQIYGSLSSVAAGLGGGSTVAANGTVTAPTYTVQGGTYNNVGGAIGAIDGDLTTLTTAVGGGGIKYFHANSPTGPDSQAVGTDAVAIGSGAVASNAGDVALGAGSTTAAAVATSGTVINGTAYSFAGATPTSTVSVGAPGAERTLTNVAAGRLTATSTDAVNGSELYATNTALTAIGAIGGQSGATTASALGGGATYDPTTGRLAAPTYTVGTMAYNNVGGAVGALQSSSPIQYSTAGSPTTPNGYVPSQDVTLVGAANGPVILHNVGAGVSSTDAANVGQLPGAFTAPQSNTFAFAQNGPGGAPVTLTNVAAGAVSATSTQAVNGSQLYGLAQGTTGAINNLAQAYSTLQNQVATNDRRASAGSAIALAATGLRYDDRPGKVSLGAGASVFRGQVGFAAGIGSTSDNGAWRYNASISFAPTETRPDVGGVVGASYSFN